MTKIPLGPTSMIIVAGVNFAGFLSKLQHGGDPFGYANAVILASLWGVMMLLKPRTNVEA